MVSGATLKNIETGEHLRWPTEWIEQTIQEIKDELATGPDYATRGARLNQCVIELVSERIKRNA